MPTTRRKQGATASTRNQSTLSFNNKSARVTKPSVHDSSSAAKKAQSKLSEPAEVEIEEPSPTTPAEDTLELSKPEPEQNQPDDEISIPIEASQPTPRKKRKAARSSAASISPREEAATKVTDAQLKKYWKAEEDARLAPRVHQSSVPLHEKILRHFDLSSQFGPCIGIQRLTRWKRADKLGLEPPVEVLAVLLREEDKTTSQGCGKLAYIDELGGGRVGIWE